RESRVLVFEFHSPANSWLHLDRSRSWHYRRVWQEPKASAWCRLSAGLYLQNERRKRFDDRHTELRHLRGLRSRIEHFIGRLVLLRELLLRTGIVLCRN